MIPDLPDARDRMYSAPRKVAVPKSADLRATCPTIYNQGESGSCTANAIAAAIEFDQRKQKLAAPFTPSRLFIYYNERALEGTVSTDSGAMLRDGNQERWRSRAWCAPSRCGRTSSRSSRTVRRRSAIRRANSAPGGRVQPRGAGPGADEGGSLRRRGIRSYSDSPCMRVSNRTWWRTSGSRRCRRRGRHRWAATR